MIKSDRQTKVRHLPHLSQLLAFHPSMAVYAAPNRPILTFLLYGRYADNRDNGDQQDAQGYRHNCEDAEECQ